MSEHPSISVIVPGYRVEATRSGVVRSLLAQTCRSGQAIVASDDGVDYLPVLQRAGICDDRLEEVSTGKCGALFPVFRRELAGEGWTTVPFAADVSLNLELLCAAPAVLGHPEPLHLKRGGSTTQGAGTATRAERGYAAILHLLEGGALRLSSDVGAAAQAEFTASRRVNRLFRRHLLSLARGFCGHITQNRRAPWAKPSWGS